MRDVAFNVCQVTVQCDDLSADPQPAKIVFDGKLRTAVQERDSKGTPMGSRKKCRLIYIVV